MTTTERRWDAADVQCSGDALVAYLAQLGLDPAVTRPYTAVKAVLDALAAAGRLTRPGVWELPAEPDPEVTRLWDRDGVCWHRTAPRTWSRSDEPLDPWWLRWNWRRLIDKRGPLSASAPEGGGRG